MPSREYLKADERQRERAYSPAVKINGGTTIYLAGHTGYQETHPGDFDSQVRAAFERMRKTLETAGGKLDDIVTMTVFLIDARHTTRMTELRTQLFGNNFPASAAITVSGFARPDIMIEVQGVAVSAK